MIGYLDHRSAPSNERRLVVVATRFEDGTFSARMYWNGTAKRGRLLRSVQDVDGVTGVEFSAAVDDKDTPHETGIASVDVPVAAAAFASSMASLIAAWVSLRPRK